MLKMDGFNDCIMGVCRRFGQEDIIAYDYDKVIEKLMLDMTYDEAVEYFEFNQIGAWVGDQTPCFIQPYDVDDDDFEAIDTERNLVNLKCIHPDCKEDDDDSVSE